jgi:hypothetical protein
VLLFDDSRTVFGENEGVFHIGEEGDVLTSPPLYHSGLRSRVGVTKPNFQGRLMPAERVIEAI